MNAIGNVEYQLRVTKNKNIATIHMGEHFVFLMHRQFRTTYQNILQDSAVNTLEIDLASVKSLDSSALGMLLLLRDRVHVLDKSIFLVKPSSLVASVFDIANFHKIFSMQTDRNPLS